MKSYFIYQSNEQKGPYTLEELIAKDLSKNTPIWHEGLADWTNASEIEELKPLFKNNPPPFDAKQTAPPPRYNQPEENRTHHTYQEPKKGNPFKPIAITILIVMGIVFAYNFLDQSGVTHLKVTVSPPKPRVGNSRTEIDPNARVLDYKQAVYATIYNDGGRGKILVTATIDQGKKHFEESKEIFLEENGSEEVYLMFDGPRALGGRIEYNVSAKSME